jgi:hypothetical protein
MAYFSNSSEGMDYESKWCSICAHEDESGCPIMNAHFWHQDTKGAAADILEYFISKDQGRCTMFISEADLADG